MWARRAIEWIESGLRQGMRRLSTTFDHLMRHPRVVDGGGRARANERRVVLNVG